MQLEKLAIAARFIIFNGKERLITLKSAGSGQGYETMEQLAPLIKEMIENEGYRVPELIPDKKKKNGITYNTIKITVQENE